MSCSQVCCRCVPAQVVICILSLLCGSLNLALAGVLGEMKMSVPQQRLGKIVWVGWNLTRCHTLLTKMCCKRWQRWRFFLMFHLYMWKWSNLTDICKSWVVEATNQGGRKAWNVVCEMFVLLEKRKWVSVFLKASCWMVKILKSSRFGRESVSTWREMVSLLRMQTDRVGELEFLASVFVFRSKICQQVGRKLVQW